MALERASDIGVKTKTASKSLATTNRRVRFDHMYGGHVVVTYNVFRRHSK